ncbi:sulfurtransferase [uncultured Roseobacter sp.]|uniref:sulfurtransferase n=1 Tax=uncultured Roseobacter sp. TaxID=114847 RepID=UPI00262522B1|nr:sulfurtransferase [uncultured Roseobacter sp.]
MNTTLSRRSILTLALGVAATCIPSISFALSDEYQNPQLLKEPQSLLSDMTIKAMGAVLRQSTLIDLRPEAEFAAGHIPGARHLPPDAVAAEHGAVAGALRPVADIEAMLGRLGIAQGERVVFYDDRGGFHAARMLWLLEYFGHRNVSVLNGGWSGWLEAGGTVTRDLGRVKPARFEATVTPRRYASAQDVLAHKGQPDAVLIDVRPPKLFAAGHIPWAINVPWSQNLDEGGRFRSEGELAAHFERHGITQKSDVIMHCQNGLASSHSYVALRLLDVPRVRVYHRSWAEWGSADDLPIATG